MPSLNPGQNTPRSSQFQTNPAAVTWSDNVTLFDGFVWLGVALPTSPVFVTPPGGETSNGTGTQFIPWMIATMRVVYIPPFVKIPICNGAIDQTTQVYYNQDINPPGTIYKVYWFSADGTLLTPASGSGSNLTINSATTVLTVPTLTYPTTLANPVPQT